MKTRLAATVGPENAAMIYRRLVEAVLRRLPSASALIVMFDPPERGADIRAWLEQSGGDQQIEFVPQARGDLGARLTHAFAHAFAAGYRRVAAVGSDCIELSPETFEAAWRGLDSHDCVIGPSFDGGYYLLALQQPQPALFENIAWSTETVFAQTIERARVASLLVTELPRLHDVDTEEDWQRAQRQL
ncbi:MAG: uncharacterized protein QOE70_1898 [Chthoniobacter sp.]|nr:uncharacterized protein [Chthoniobacter sp.]